MAFAPVLKKAYWSLAIAGGLYFVFVFLLLNGWIQRQALYASKFRSWWQDPNKTEEFGFLKNQVRPFKINTPDAEVLYAWHILPLSTYARYETSLIKEPASYRDDLETSIAFKLLARDPESRLVISFHGNAGTVAQGWRTDTYRALSTGASDKTHVMTIDYRGFGKSTGSPTERGLIIDGCAAVNWALKVARIPPERIVLLGQSLGTAVATAVAEHFTLEEKTEFKGIILIAGFSDIPTLMSTYTVGGILPILSPMRPYPFLQQFFAKRIQETWFTARRLGNLVRRSSNINVQIIHSTNDFDIPWSHSNTLFHAAANATSEEGLSSKQIDATKIHRDLEGFGWTNSWISVQEDGGRKSIRQEIVRNGGHNRVPTYPVVAKAVLNVFYGEDYPEQRHKNVLRHQQS